MGVRVLSLALLSLVSPLFARGISDDASAVQTSLMSADGADVDRDDDMSMIQTKADTKRKAELSLKKKAKIASRSNSDDMGAVQTSLMSADDADHDDEMSMMQVKANKKVGVTKTAKTKAKEASRPQSDDIGAVQTSLMSADDADHEDEMSMMQIKTKQKAGVTKTAKTKAKEASRPQSDDVGAVQTSLMSADNADHEDEMSMMQVKAKKKVGVTKAAKTKAKEASRPQSDDVGAVQTSLMSADDADHEDEMSMMQVKAKKKVGVTRAAKTKAKQASRPQSDDVGAVQTSLMSADDADHEDEMTMMQVKAKKKVGVTKTKTNAKGAPRPH